tara:strand:+ start:1435 stop:1620 length:186 start_codon:yes stop_codon:yes gene_type:complete
MNKKLIEKMGSLLLRNSVFKNILLIKYNNEIDINNLLVFFIHTFTESIKNGLNLKEYRPKI